jgi:hypothetical protein
MHHVTTLAIHIYNIHDVNILHSIPFIAEAGDIFGVVMGKKVISRKT